MAVEDIKVLHADTFRRIDKGRTKSGKTKEANYQWKPTVVIQAGNQRLNFLDIATLWRFTNAVIYPERYSFSDFKGIVEMFLPAEFFEAIIADCTHTLSINAQRNIYDEWIVTGVEKYHAVLPNYHEITNLVQDMVPGSLSTRFVNNDTCLFTWGRKEIEIRTFKSSDRHHKFVLCARYYHTTHIVQPIEAKEVRGSLASISADTLVVLLEDAIHALAEANDLCFQLEEDEYYYAPLTGTLKFKDRNRLEHERWLEIKGEPGN